MSRTIPSKIQSHALTDVGQTRSENQDSVGLFSTRSGSLVAVVADGMGGHRGGATASQLAVATLEELLTAPKNIDDRALSDAITKANERIYGKSQAEPDLRGMGTTCVAMLFHPDGRAWIGHVGDSRAYRMRAGTLEPLTYDHSLVQVLVQAGELTAEEAETDPRRNEILRSVGVAKEVEIDIIPVTLQPGDRYLLCSDGLSGVVKDDDIAPLLGDHDPEESTRLMVDRANANGGPDNISAIALHYPDPDKTTEQLHAIEEGREADPDGTSEKTSVVEEPREAAPDETTEKSPVVEETRESNPNDATDEVPIAEEARESNPTDTTDEIPIVEDPLDSSGAERQEADRVRRTRHIRLVALAGLILVCTLAYLVL